MKDYKELEIYKISFQLAIDTYHLSMMLPKHEMYEQGSQIRRASQSIKNNIAEGCGRSRYKQEYVRYLVFAYASCKEVLSQLDLITVIHFKENPPSQLIKSYYTLSRKLFKYIQYVEKSWQSG